MCSAVVIYTSVQLLFHVRHNTLNLPMDPLRVVLVQLYLQQGVLVTPVEPLKNKCLRVGLWETCPLPTGDYNCSDIKPQIAAEHSL